MNNTWAKLETPVLMITSLVIQALLTFLAPLRKTCSNAFLIRYLWLLYLCADSIALFVIGLISRSPLRDDDPRSDILAFWAPFLLLHLGGPDTITALALEDNELWHRHALQLVSQTAVTIYVFVLSMVRGRHNRLWLPMALMFIDGFIKYAERTYALYLASREGIRANLGEEPTSSTNKWADEYYSAETSYIPSRFEVCYACSDDDLDHNNRGSDHIEANNEGKVNNYASDHIEDVTEEGVNHALDHNDSVHSEVNNYASDHIEDVAEEGVNHALDHNDSVHSEVNNYASDHIEDVTEEGVNPAWDHNDSVHSEVNKSNDVERIVNYAYNLYDNFKCILADDVLNLKDDHKLVEKLFFKEDFLIGIKIIATELNLIYDILHTKVYLVNKKLGMLRLVCFLSLISASFLFFFDIHRSNRNYKPVDVGVSFTLVAGAIFLDIVSFFRFIHSDWFIIKVSDLMPANPSTRINQLFQVLLQSLLKWSTRCRAYDAKRWCQSTSSYNLLSCSFRRKDFNKFLELIYIKRIKDCLIDWLYVEKFVINEDPHLKFIFGVVLKKAKVVRGDKAGMEEVCSARGNLVSEEKYCLVSEYLRPWTTDVEDYSESLLTWHLATDICYWVESPDYRKQKSEFINYCGLSKQLSDYMVYILLRRQDLVPQLVSKSDVHFKRTEEDIIAANNKVITSSDKTVGRNKMEIFCEYVVRRKLDDRIAAQVSKSNDSQSVFDEACCLAKQLMMFGDNKWEIISKVWVEMLCYAAIRSSPRYNFASLSKGGELITLVWLFISHLGFRHPLPKDRGLRSAKLIIGK